MAVLDEIRQWWDDDAAVYHSPGHTAQADPAQADPAQADPGDRP